MLGIWFNHDDIDVRKREHDNLEILKQFGFTDIYILIKGIKKDVRNIPEYLPRLEWLFREGKALGLRTHGVFISSNDWAYTSKHFKNTDINLFGNRKSGMINHLDEDYRNYLISSILTAAEHFPMDGIQLDYLRFRDIVVGWSPDEEAVYSSYGVDVKKLKGEIDLLYDYHKPDRNLSSLLRRFEDGDPDLRALSLGRRSILKDFTGYITKNLRQKLPGKELSITMMPTELDPEKYAVSLLYFGQSYRDLSPLADHLIPMAYAATLKRDTEWIGEIAKEAVKVSPDSIIGLECEVPRSSDLLMADINTVRDQTDVGISLFRYGRMILALPEGEDTLLYNTYPGTVTRLILKSGTKEIEMRCTLDEASILRIKGHWELIRPFGFFVDCDDKRHEGELCAIHSDSLQKYF